MDAFYFFTIFIALLSTLNEKIAFVFMVTGLLFFLFFLPDTGFDYGRYQTTFNEGYFDGSFPFFKTNSAIDAEPLYLWYNSFMSFFLNGNFQLFLSVNFLVCLLIAKISFKKLSNSYYYNFWFFVLPVIVPTIFYYSPRSSISFFLIFLGFIKLSKKQILPAIFIFLGGISIHSQFILISFLLIITYLFLKLKSKFDITEGKKFIFIITGISIILLSFISNFSEILASLFSYLPSAKLATSKLHYLEDAREGFRLTSILSILIYPLLGYNMVEKVRNKNFSITKDKSWDEAFVLLLFAVLCYGAAINISFFNNPHLSGRLSRFSDYLGMGLLLPLYFSYFFKRKFLKIILIILIVIAPFIFQTLYHNVEWGL